MSPEFLRFPEISPFLVQIGGFGVRWYALAYIVGLILGWRYVERAMRRPALWSAGGPPMKPEAVESLLFFMALGVIIGGRLGFVLFYKFDYYIQHPAEVLQTWQGGMSFHGGLLGVIVVTIAYCLFNRLRLLSVGDAVACAAPIGLFFGRIANFINAELWGRETTMPWGMKFPTFCPTRPVDWCDAPGSWVYFGDEVVRHPSQLYEAALEGAVLFVALWWLSRRRGALKRPGTCIGVFLIGYGLARMAVENYRQPDAFLGEGGFIAQLGDFGVTQGQLLSLPMVLIGLGFVLFARRRA